MYGRAGHVGKTIGEPTDDEAASLLAFALAALLASLFLVGQVVAEYASRRAADSGCSKPSADPLAGAASASVARASPRPRRATIGVAAAYITRSPGRRSASPARPAGPRPQADWAVPPAAGGRSPCCSSSTAPALLAWSALTAPAGPRHAPGSAVAAAASAAGLPVPVMDGVRFALEAAVAGPRCRCSRRSAARWPACSACSPVYLLRGVSRDRQPGPVRHHLAA